MIKEQQLKVKESIALIEKVISDCKKRIFDPVSQCDLPALGRWRYFVNLVKQYFKRDNNRAIFLLSVEKGQSAVGMCDALKCYYRHWVETFTHLLTPLVNKRKLKSLVHSLLAQLKGALLLDHVFQTHHYREHCYRSMRAVVMRGK